MPKRSSKSAAGEGGARSTQTAADPLAESAAHATRLQRRRQERVDKKLQSRRIKPLGDGLFSVQSARGGEHLVFLAPNRSSCTDCVHFDAGTGPCDHMLMVRRFMEEGQPAELLAPSHAPRQQTERDWPFYKACRRLMPPVVELMLRDLCVAFLDNARLKGGVGRPPLPVRDVIVCANARRMVRSSGLEAEHVVDRYFANKWLLHPVAPCEDAISKGLTRDDIADAYVRLIALAADPLKTLESVIAIDAQWWRTPCSLFDVNVKDQETNEKRLRKSNFIRLQVALGWQWKIVTAIAILSEEDGETPQTIDLVRNSSVQFGKPSLLLADTAYCADAEFQWLKDKGIEARIPFKSNAKLKNNGSAWDFNLQGFLDADDHYWSEYYMRLVVESYFGALYRSNGHVKKLKSKTLISQANELYSIVLNYQLRMLLRAYLCGAVVIPWLSAETEDLIGKLTSRISRKIIVPRRLDPVTIIGASEGDMAQAIGNVIRFPSRKVS
jgi:hypothetical protein